MTKLIPSYLFSILIVPSALFAQKEEPGKPNPLRGDILVEYYMKVSPGAVRIEQNPNTGNIYYNTLRGDIYRIIEQGFDELVYTAEDHTVTNVQGILFHGDDLFVSGNIPVNEGRGMIGRVKRGTSKANGERVWTTFVESDEYGSMMAAFDHAWNAITVDPDEKYLFLNSGSRTDHGEVQDIQGTYKGHRERPITSVIFKLPIDGKDLYIPDDEEALNELGYVYARGVRNVFSMAFSPNDDLFGVDNSGDFHHNESMYWLREGHHYGFPWIMGETKNPQQFADYDPNPQLDPGLERFSHAFNLGLFHNDPDFPQIPEDLVVTPPVQNIGPDANYYMDFETGEIHKGDEKGRSVGTFTPHRSPLGLFFDSDSLLVEDFRGDAFVLSYTVHNSGLMRPFYGDKPMMSQDLMHLKLFYSKTLDNYIVQSTRIVDNFDRPTDALMIGNEVYVINNKGGQPSHIWKVTLPAD